MKNKVEEMLGYVWNNPEGNHLKVRKRKEYIILYSDMLKPRQTIAVHQYSDQLTCLNNY